MRRGPQRATQGRSSAASDVYKRQVLLGSVIFLAWYLAGRYKVVLNTILTAVMVILIGYSAIAIIVIRSSAQPPLNENQPDNPFSLLYFLNREQYGQRPLFRGAYYNAPVIDYEDGKPKYSIEDGKYKITAYNLETIHDPRFITLFPRMWSDQPDHARVYQEWGKIKGVPVTAVSYTHLTLPTIYSV